MSCAYVVRGQTGGHRQGHDRDQLGGVAAHYAAAQDHPCGRVGDDLDETAGVVVDDGLGRRHERHLGDADPATLCEGVGLGQAHVGDLGLGEHRRGGLVVVEVAVGAVVGEAQGVLGDLAALHVGDRRERQLARGRRRRSCAARRCGSGGRRGCSRLRSLCPRWQAQAPRCLARRRWPGSRGCRWRSGRRRSAR